jgi:hypothetical protein
VAENFLIPQGFMETKKINTIATGDVFGILVEILETYSNGNFKVKIMIYLDFVGLYWGAGMDGNGDFPNFR